MVLSNHRSAVAEFTEAAARVTGFFSVVAFPDALLQRALAGAGEKRS
jgi:hypothetical protein